MKEKELIEKKLNEISIELFDIEEKDNQDLTRILIELEDLEKILLQPDDTTLTKVFKKNWLINRESNSQRNKANFRSQFVYKANTYRFWIDTKLCGKDGLSWNTGSNW